MKDLKEATSLLRRFDESVKWFEENYNSLKKKYDGNYVAVDDRKVVGYNTDLRKLVKNLKHEGIDPRNTLIEYVTNKKVELILYC